VGFRRALPSSQVLPQPSVLIPQPSDLGLDHGLGLDIQC
jgi:hypothetical protein